MVRIIFSKACSQWDPCSLWILQSQMIKKFVDYIRWPRRPLSHCGYITATADSRSALRSPVTAMSIHSRFAFWPIYTRCPWRIPVARTYIASHCGFAFRLWMFALLMVNVCIQVVGIHNNIMHPCTQILASVNLAHTTAVRMRSVLTTTWVSAVCAWMDLQEMDTRVQVN